MREIELLTALAQTDGGVQVNICRNGIIVSTCYTPSVRGTGKTVSQAAWECTQKLLSAVKSHPTYREWIPDVLKALDEYDRRMEQLRM